MDIGSTSQDACRGRIACVGRFRSGYQRRGVSLAVCRRMSVDSRALSGGIELCQRLLRLQKRYRHSRQSRSQTCSSRGVGVVTTDACGTVRSACSGFCARSYAYVGCRLAAVVCRCCRGGVCIGLFGR